MTATCPHCLQPLELDPETVALLQDETHLECPSCGGPVPLASLTRNRPIAPLQPEGTADADTIPRGDPNRPKRSVIQAFWAINRNLRILGGVALLVLGGLAVFLATRKPGKTVIEVVNTRHTLIDNEYFTKLIASGATTAKDLEAVDGIQPYGPGFIGVSKEKLTWQQAGELAKRTGAEILDLATAAKESPKELSAWLATSYPPQHGWTVWVRDKDEVKVIDSPDVLTVTLMGRPRQAFLRWPRSVGAPIGWAWNIQPQFDEVMPFGANGQAAVRVGEEWKMIDQAGKDAGSPPPELLHEFTSSGCAGIRLGDKVGLIDRTGKVLAKPEWDDLQEFTNGFTPVKRDGKWGYLDATGTLAIPCEWDDAWRFSPEGYAVVTRAEKRGFIDRSGKVIIQPEWDGALNFCKEGIGAVRRGALWGLVNTTGKLLCEPIYAMKWQARRFDLGFIPVRLPGQPETIYLGMDGKPLDRTVAESRATAKPAPALPPAAREEEISFEIKRPYPPAKMHPKLSLRSERRDSEYRDRYNLVGQATLLVNRLGDVVMPGVNAHADFTNDFIPYAMPPKFGLMEINGRVLVAPQWDEVRILSPAWVWFRVGGKCGLADGTGKVIVEPRWDAIRVMRVDTGSLDDDGKRILLGPGGVPILSPWIRAEDGDKIVILRNNGQPVLPATLAGAEYVDFYGAEQVAITEPAAEGRKLWSLYAPATNTKTSFPRASAMLWNWGTAAFGLIWIKDWETGFWNLMDQSGRALGYAQIEMPTGWEMCEGQGILHNHQGQYFIDPKGQRIGTGTWAAVREFREGCAAVQRDGKWGFIDLTGRVISEPTWDEVRDFRNGVAVVATDRRWGLIDAKGKPLDEPKWEALREFSHGLAAVRVNGRWGYIDVTGKTAIEPVWDVAGDFQPMEKPTVNAAGATPTVFAHVSIADNAAIISRTGALLCDPKYYRFRVEGEFLMAITKYGRNETIRLSDGKLLGLPAPEEWVQVAGDRVWLSSPKGNPNGGSDWALCDVEGNLLTPYRWARPWASPRISPFSGGTSLARTPLGTYGLLSPVGKELLAPLYERIGWLAPERAEVWSATAGGLIDAGGKWLFKDTDKSRIARFGDRYASRIQVPPCHGLVVIEDTPKWGYAKLISGPIAKPRE